jgi:hypothetical protein
LLDRLFGRRLLHFDRRAARAYAEITRTTTAAGVRLPRVATNWERRLSAGLARRGLDALGARPAAPEQEDRPECAAGWPAAHVAACQPGRRRRGIEPRRQRAGWKAGAPSEPRDRETARNSDASSACLRAPSGIRATPAQSSAVLIAAV